MRKLDYWVQKLKTTKKELKAACRAECKREVTRLDAELQDLEKVIANRVEEMYVKGLRPVFTRPLDTNVLLMNMSKQMSHLRRRAA